MSEEVFRAVVAALDAGERAALATIIRTQGSTPQRVGAKMLVYPDGRIVGTIGGGCYESDAAGKARQLANGGRPAVVRYELSDDVAAESGLICGGQMEVYIEPVEGAPHLYVAGAGHVGQHVARLAAEAGFRVHVGDDRAKFANAERFPAAAEVAVEDIPGWLSRAPISREAFVVVVTRGHRHDMEALRALAGREVCYLGMIGSRAKVARVREALAGEVPASWLDRVHAPIGLDSGAVTPAEIAVSIVAELIAVRRGKGGGPAGAPSLAWHRPGAATAQGGEDGGAR